jgi:hypothetical protein
VAVAFDAVGPSSAGTNGGSPLTWTHVCGAGATLLLVGVSFTDFSSSAVTLTATYTAWR